jgi:SAM-dependent methyltransferase
LIAPGGSVLDLACDSGRHLRWLAARGFRVTGVDRDAAAVAQLAPIGEIIVAEIESGAWPLAGRRFDAVVVTNYLWRPVLPRIVESLAPAGVLIYETFAIDNETVGRPSRPDFLLRRGELIAALAGLRVVAFEDGFLDAPERFVQRIVACRESVPTASPQRHRLAGDPDRPG